MRFILSTSLALFLGLPVLAQSPKARDGAPPPREKGSQARDKASPDRGSEAELQMLRAKINELEARIRNSKEGERKPADNKKNDRGRGGPMGPMGGSSGPVGPSRIGNSGPGGPPKSHEFHAAGSMRHSMGEHHHPMHPGFDRLTTQEQTMFRALMHKMMGGDSHPSLTHHGFSEHGTGHRGGSRGESSNRSSVNERLDRIEKLLEELRHNRR